MKLTLPATAALLLLGAFTALPAADTPAARKFTDAELLETLGWIAGAKAGLSQFEFTAEEQTAIVKGFQSATSGKDIPFKQGEIEEQFYAFMDSRQQAAEAKQIAEIEKKAAAGDPDAKKMLEQINAQKAEMAARAAAQKADAEKQSAIAKDNKAKGEKFLADKKLQKGVIALPSGLLYEIVQAGKGDYPKAVDTVKVNYTGTFIDGTKFDSSSDHGGAVEFPLNQVVPGWTEGIQKINKGGKIKLYIPSSLGYGDAGTGPLPPGSTLVFDVELIDFTPAKP